VDERAGQGELLLHPAGELVRPALPEGPQPGELEESLATRAEIPHPVDLAKEIDVLGDIEIPIQRESL
jgi:hypothetical protein